MLFHQILKIWPLQPHCLCSLCHVPVALHQGTEDEVSLDRIDGLFSDFFLDSLQFLIVGGDVLHEEFNAFRNGQLLQGDLFPFAKDHRPLNGILELPHVPGPVVGGQSGQGVIIKSLDLLSYPLAELFQKVVGNRQDIRFPLSQRRGKDGVDKDAVIEILPERALP